MNRGFTLFHNHSHYSLLDGLQSPEDIVSRAVELGMTTIGITDHGTLSGIIKFYKACKDKKIKPMIGCEMYMGKDKEEKDRANNHIIVIAKNYEGYKDLIKLNNLAAANFYYKPLIKKEQLFEIGEKGNLIISAACLAGEVASSLFTDSKETYSKQTADGCRSLLKEDWLEYCKDIIEEWVSVFGDDFYLEAMIEGHPAQEVVLECFRVLSKETGVKLCASCDSHFSRPEDRIAHEIMICNQTKETLKDREEKRQGGVDMLFADNSKYYIHSREEMLENFTEEEINNTFEMSEKVESYDIDLSSPKIPQIKISNEYKDVDDFIYQRCMKELKKLKKHKDKEYLDRFNFEFETFKNAIVGGTSLNSYFALLLDIVDFVKSKGSMPGVGRGSAAGCIISYLLGITRLDPIETKLSFQRFFNTGRLAEGHISLPDIDLDVSADLKEDVIKHLKKIWGDERAIQISTFGILRPKSSIKDTLRVCGIPFEQTNILTKVFPDDEIKHDEEVKNTIEDALKVSDEFREIMEPYKKEVELAKAIEGTVRNKGIHAAGVLILAEGVEELIPLEWDSKSKSFVCAFDMHDSECFCVKIDILGLKLLSIFDITQAVINKSKIKPIEYEAKKEYLYFPEESIKKEEKMEEKNEFIFNEEIMYDFLSKYANDGLEIIERKDFKFVMFKVKNGKTINTFCLNCIDGEWDIKTQNKVLIYVAYMKYYFKKEDEYFILMYDNNSNIIYKIFPENIATKSDEKPIEYADVINGKIMLRKK